MTTGRTRASILVALLAVFLVTPSAHAVLSKDQLSCSKAITKNSLGYVKGKLKILAKCRNADLKDGSCMATPDPAAIAKLVGKLSAAITKACSFPIGNLTAMGFPGPCSDPNIGDGFTLADLQACILSAHESVVDQLIGLQYDATLPLLLPAADLKCQAEVAKQGAGLAVCILKNVQKCRDDGAKGKPIGTPPDFCAANHPKTKAAIDKCKAKLTAAIAGKCTTSQIMSLKVCTPDQPNAADAATCLINEHSVRIDGTEIIVPPDLIDYEYATRGGLCGDGIINSLNEECDGPADAACPGQCGEPFVGPTDGHFACLCKTKPRMVIVEHDTSDTDNGWTGNSSDGTVVEGGNYLVDLYDCDGFGLCNVGPSCSSPPHSPCAVGRLVASGTTGDSICIGLGQGTCRKERTAAGPHCHMDIQKKCNPSLPSDPVCNAPGDFCSITYHGPPVAQIAGGVGACAVSLLSEDIVGTANILDGTAAVKIRQNAVTHQVFGAANKPCPVCGDFCAISRARCTLDADCAPGMGPCVHEPVCSDGPRIDKSCRPTAPFGGPNTFFGVTSIDCPPNPGQNITGIGLDINADPRTTGTVTLTPNFACSDAGFSDKACVGGANEGRICTGASECPGGTCNFQCFCAGQLRPNPCDDACVGGPNDKEACAVHSECPSGFCHKADCRANPADTDSTQEGICSQGVTVGTCSVTTFQPCTLNSNCAPPQCPYCTGGETCEISNQACFVNSGIVRTGTPRTPNGVSAAIYCVPGNGAAINTVAGFPGPGAVYQQETMLVVP